MTQSNWRWLALVGATWLLGAGCINVQPDDGVYSCAHDTDCPTNYLCDLTVHTCWKKGDHPIQTPHAGQDMSGSVDMGMDGGGDTQQCHDGVMNGNETDIDCGGGMCLACATGLMCTVNKDCASMLCHPDKKICVATKCEDGSKDGNETDIDCGGGMCLACGDGKGCKANADCTSMLCNMMSGVCAGSLCSDGLKDGQESDVDCGGPTCTTKCGGGKKCGGDSDCVSGSCNVGSHTCAASACENGVKDPGETDIDCGGTTCMGCADTKACKVNGDCVHKFCNVMTLTCVADQCHDGLKNGDETDIDCGGACGATCKVNQMCKVPGDCASPGTCSAGHVCVSSQCMDGTKDGMETDKDCGGGTCAVCQDGQGCSDGTRDCVNHYCNVPLNMCVNSQCKDGAIDGSETDKDCGGSMCPQCATGLMCKTASDCNPSWCDSVSKKCVANQCLDNLQDNGESDVDCGGAATGCAKCDPGKGCGTTNANCKSGYCNFTNNLCANGQCDDGRQDGTESDKDCGGSCTTKCNPNQMCNTDTDCGSGACDYMPSPHLCVTSTCADHHQDNNETDVDCGGPCGSNCAKGKGCLQNSDCVTDFCDQMSHTCACGGVNQACCANAMCANANLCTGTVTCNGSNICVAGNPVTCPAPTQCTTVAACNPQTGMCPVTNLTGACDNSGSDICVAKNTSTCSNGACTGGTKVPDRCDPLNANVAQTCSSNMWMTKATCPGGCSNGVCVVQTPTVTATLVGSDVAVSWTALASGVTCTLYRSDNGGTAQQPAAIISPCPASVQGTCNAYDHFLFRGSYTYELHCSDSTGATGKSAPSNTVHPGIEFCIGDRTTNAVEVHTPSGNTNDQLERMLSTNAALNYSYGVAYLPPPSGHTNCAWGDTGCGKIFVTSYMGDQVHSFNRRAYDGSSNDASPELPNVHEQFLTIVLKDTSGNQIGSPYRPIGVAIIGTELIVAMNGSSGIGYLAGYPTNFATGSPLPNWYLQTNSGTNKLSAPLAVAIDNGPGTSDANGDVYVGSSFGGAFVVNGYHLTALRTGINANNHINNNAQPFVTITPPNSPNSLAMDQANHILYVGTLQNTTTLFKYQISGSTASQLTSLTTSGVAPTGLYFFSDANSAAALYLVDNLNGLIQSYAPGAMSPTINFPVSNLTGNGAGIVVCN